MAPVPVAVADVTAGEITAETAVAANLFENGLGGIFGCPSWHDSNPSMTEALKLFLPYFPLHIQHLIRMYLKISEFMHTFEMLRNMMNHMEEYQELFKMFESTDSDHSGFSMPDIFSMKKMMEGSDLVDEFTYVEGSSGTGGNGS